MDKRVVSVVAIGIIAAAVASWTDVFAGRLKLPADGDFQDYARPCVFEPGPAELISVSNGASAANSAALNPRSRYSFTCSVDVGCRTGTTEPTADESTDKTFYGKGEYIIATDAEVLWIACEAKSTSGTCELLECR